MTAALAARFNNDYDFSPKLHDAANESYYYFESEGEQGAWTSLAHGTQSAMGSFSQLAVHYFSNAHMQLENIAEVDRGWVQIEYLRQPTDRTKQAIKRGFYRETTPRDLAISRLRLIEKFGAGWDGECASQPNRLAIQNAKSFVENILVDLPFSVSPATDGSVDLVVQIENGKVICSFEGDGKVGIFAVSQEETADPLEFDIPQNMIQGAKVSNYVRQFLK